MTLLALLSFLIIPASLAQEKESGKRIKIITMDESGEKIIIDTTISVHLNMEDLDLPENLKDIFIHIDGEKIHKFHHEGGEHGSYFYISSDCDDKDIHIHKSEKVVMKEYDGDVFTIIETNKDDGDTKLISSYTIVDGDTVIKEYRTVSVSNTGENYVWVSSDDNKEKNEINIYRSSDNDLDDDEKEIIVISSGNKEHIKIKGDAVIRIIDGKVKIEKNEGEEKTVVKKKKESKKK